MMEQSCPQCQQFKNPGAFSGESKVCNHCLQIVEKRKKNAPRVWEGMQGTPISAESVKAATHKRRSKMYSAGKAVIVGSDK